MVQPPSEDDMEQPGLPSENGRSTVRNREGFDKTLKTNDETATEIAVYSRYFRYRADFEQANGLPLGSTLGA